MEGSSVRPPAEVVTGFTMRDPSFWLTLTCWAVVGFSAVQIATFSFGRDQSIYALIGDGVLAGQMPYRDLWDFKPPGIFFVYALAQALFGKSMAAVRLVEVLVLLGVVASLRRLGGVFFENRAVGLVGGALAALIHFQLDFWHTGQPETFGGLLTLLGLVLTVREPLRRWLAAFGTGLLFGSAALLKPPLGGGAVVCAAYLAQRARTRGESSRRALGVAGVVALGGALPTLLTLLWFWARGALGDLVWTLGEFTPGYTAVSWQDRRAAEMLYYAIEEAFFGFSALAAAGIIAAIAMRPLHAREREGIFLVLGVIAIELAGIAMQGKFFAYHYGATLPLVAFIAGIGLYKLWMRCLQGGVGGILAFFSFVIVAALMRYPVGDLPQSVWERARIRIAYLLDRPPFEDRPAMDRELAYVADFNLDADRRVALAVRQLTKQSDSVFVWGFEPAIYWLSERRPATRFIYNVPQRSAWERESAREALMADLHRNPPRVIVVQARDVFPAVTGTRTDSRDELPTFPALSSLLDTEYRFVKSIEDFDLYLRPE